MDSFLTFDLSPKQIKYKEILDKKFIELEIWAISDINPNRNDSHFTLDSLIKAAPHVQNTPIVGFFENNDFTTHEGKADYDMELKREFWNTEKGERILGWVRESDPVEIVEKDGLHWLKFRCALCVTYCYRQVRRLLRDKKKKVSVEITVHQHEYVDGIEQILDFSLNGVTILGSKNGKAVIEGIPGAHLSVLESLDENAIREQRRVLAFAYQGIDEQNESDKSVEKNENFDGKNTKKEVRQANMEQQENVRTDECEVYSYEIKIDDSKEAMSDKPWGEVDKTQLRKKVVGAENFKTVAPKIFLDLREGWEDGEVSKLKYPVMELKDDTAVYNRGALGSAKAYAEQHGESMVLQKLEKIYEDLELDEDEEEAESYASMCKECVEEYCEDCGCDGEGDCADCDGSEPEAEEHESIKVVELTPDVAVVEKTSEVVNEGAPELTMEKELERENVEMDLGIPTCEDAPKQEPSEAEIHDGKEVAKDMIEPEGEIMPDGVDIVVSKNNEPNKIVHIENDDPSELKKLQEKCCNLEKQLSEKEAYIHACEEKLCTFNDIKTQLEYAQQQLKCYRCKDMEAQAVALMENENIKEELYSNILNKCRADAYASVEDIKTDVAVAIYSSRETQEKRFSFSLPMDAAPYSEDVKRESLSLADRIKKYIGKMK